MKILVTGGAGYIGSHACKALATAGYVPISYDNLSRGHRSAVQWGPLEQGDILDVDRLRAVFKRHRPRALIHFAAYASVRESMQYPFLYFRNNISGTASLLQTLLEFETIPIVFSSTCATYGIPDAIPIRECHPQRPVNPYGFSKLAGEQLLKNLEFSSGLRSVSLRYFNAAGADPDGDIGENHDPAVHLIPLVLKAARDGGSVQIFGDDYETDDGTCIRDYIHVSDLADAHIRALDYLLRGGISVQLNLANARGYSVKQVIATAEHVCSRQIRTVIKPRQAGDPPILIGDASRAHKLLDWRSSRADLETQISDAWAWFQRRNS
jgi:UDP-arabinose 4-epimerase